MPQTVALTAFDGSRTTAKLKQYRICPSCPAHSEAGDGPGAACQVPGPASRFPVPSSRFPTPGSRLPIPACHFTLRLCTIACCKKATLSAPRHRCENSNAVSVFGTHQGMYMVRAPKRRKKSKTLSSSIKTGLKSAKFGTLFALPILTFCPSNPSGASARAVLTLQKGQKRGAPF